MKRGAFFPVSLENIMDSAYMQGIDHAAITVEALYGFYSRKNLAKKIREMGRKCLVDKKARKGQKHKQKRKGKP